MDVCCTAAISKYKKQSDRTYAKCAAFGVNFEGLRCVAINTLLPNSDLFAGVWHADYDAEISFGWRAKEWSVLMTSSTVDLLSIAEKHGGGGTPYACGFVCDELPFDLKGGK